MDSNTFRRALEAHQVWLRTKGEDGALLELEGEDLRDVEFDVGNTFEDAILKDCDLTGLDLSELLFKDAVLDKSKLTSCKFDKSDLRGAYLEKCILDKASFLWADLRGAHLDKCFAKEADFREAKMVHCELPMADLDNADFREADLEGANLTEAYMSNADFREADLRQATLEKCEARKADFRKATMTDAAMANAKFELADFEGADLDSANMESCNLKDTDLRRASLIGTSFENAYVEGAMFSGSHAAQANFSGTTGDPSSTPDDLEGASVADSPFHPLYGMSNRRALDWANMEVDHVDSEHWCIRDREFGGGAFLVPDSSVDEAVEAATMVDVDDVWQEIREQLSNNQLSPYDAFSVDLVCDDANIGYLFPGMSEEDVINAYEEWADATGEAFDYTIEENLRGPQPVTGVIVKGEVKDLLVAWIESMKVQPYSSRTTYGRSRKAAKQLRSIEQPLNMAALKRTFPEAFEVAKLKIKGQTLSPTQAKELIAEMGITWTITTTRWSSELQRLSPKPNDVMQFNIDIRAITTEKAMIDMLQAMRETSYRSMHPVKRRGELLTIGWVRYTDFEQEGALLIEEVQSDFPTVRKESEAVGEFRQQLEERGQKETLDRALKLLAPFVDRFYEDAVSAIFDLAEEFGRAVVEMLTYRSKAEMGSPMSVYEKLPKRLGMKRTKDVRSNVAAAEVWSMPIAQPNPARRRRTKPAAIRTWTRGRGFDAKGNDMSKPKRRSNPVSKTGQQKAVWPDQSSIKVVWYDDGPTQRQIEQAWRIAKASEIILSDKDLKAIAFFKGHVAGALFDSLVQDRYSFDIVVDPDYRDRGIGGTLLDAGLDEFAELQEHGVVLDLHVVNPHMRAALLRRGFEIEEGTDVKRSNPVSKTGQHQKAVSWAEGVYRKKLETGDLPNLGRGYPREVRAARAVQSIALRKLYVQSGRSPMVRKELPLSQKDREFWQSVYQWALDKEQQVGQVE